jgi:hypothetical protein
VYRTEPRAFNADEMREAVELLARTSAQADG